MAGLKGKTAGTEGAPVCRIWSKKSTACGYVEMSPVSSYLNPECWMSPPFKQCRDIQRCWTRKDLPRPGTASFNRLGKEGQVLIYFFPCCKDAGGMKFILNYS